MGLYIYACILCGFAIYDSSAWLGEYRAIYSDPRGPSITGVGCYNENETWNAPSDPARRWDDVNEQDAQEELPVMRQPPVAGRHGFVLHEACWCLLRKACEPEPVPLRRLLEMCESLPFPLRTNGVCWGHDYGKLLPLDAKSFYPWYELFYQSRERTACFSDARENPFGVSELYAILTHPARRPMAKTPVAAVAQDCFSRLPWEVREKIAILLATTDALNLRLASRSFLPLYSSAMFWASRFDADGERGFLFEAKDKRDATELMSLYRVTGARLRSPRLRNRRRIWGLIRQLRTIASLRCADSNFCASDQKLPCQNWIRLAGDENTEDSNGNWLLFYEGCRPMETVVLDVPLSMVKIGITAVDLGSRNYITCIRLLAEGEPDISAGYVSDCNEVFCNLDQLHGFRLAVGPGGVRALQVVGQRGSSSRWIGRARQFPVSERLVLSEPIKAVKVTLDGFKITGLAVSSQKAPLPQVPNPLAMSLRKAALWYPTIPPEELYLNDEAFSGQNPLRTGYRPLHWMHFGGQQGKYLEHIVEISARHFHKILSLDFLYDDDNSREASLHSRLGCCDTERFPPNSTFAINGAGGERIVSIEVGTEQYENPRAYEFLKHGHLRSIKMTTNRGRVYEIGKTGNDVRMRPLRVAEATTITGLYASHHMAYGLISLGVISEML